MEFKPCRVPSIGAELEFQLLDTGTLDLTDKILPLVELYPDSAFVKPEYVQNTVEIASRPCADVDELEPHLKALAKGLAVRCAALDMRLCGAGTHPFSKRLALITPLPRYKRLASESGHVGRTQITFGLHVHISVLSGDEAIALIRALKPYLPLLIAVSASSPFWRGYDTEFVAYRQRILAATRAYGVPPTFQSWDEFDRFFESTLHAGIFESINDIHWDIRPRPSLGTVEVRVLDMQPTVSDAMVLAETVRLLAMLLRADPARLPPELPQALPWWLERENHFQASRLGLDGKYVADDAGTPRPMRDMWRAVIAALRPLARTDGSRARLDRLEHLVEKGAAAARQRAVYQDVNSLSQVVASLAGELERDLTLAGEQPS
ncbi:MAG: carboxylate-amine ligase [Pseudomonadota bacterium]